MNLTTLYKKGVTENKISNEKDFKEYIYKILKKKHGDKFDSKIADKMVVDLKKKYKLDFGAMVGAVQNS